MLHCTALRRHRCRCVSKRSSWWHVEFDPDPPKSYLWQTTPQQWRDNRPLLVVRVFFTSRRTNGWHKRRGTLHVCILSTNVVLCELAPCVSLARKKIPVNRCSLRLLHRFFLAASPIVVARTSMHASPCSLTFSVFFFSIFFHTSAAQAFAMVSVRDCLMFVAQCARFARSAYCPLRTLCLFRLHTADSDVFAPLATLAVACRRALAREERHAGAVAALHVVVVKQCFCVACVGFLLCALASANA